MRSWVGITDDATEGVWVYLNGTTAEEDDLLWARGEPNNSGNNEDCADIQENHYLNDGGCDEELQAICQKSACSN